MAVSLERAMQKLILLSGRRLSSGFLERHRNLLQSAHLAAPVIRHGQQSIVPHEAKECRVPLRLVRWFNILESIKPKRGAWVSMGAGW